MRQKKTGKDVWSRGGEKKKNMWPWSKTTNIQNLLRGIDGIKRGQEVGRKIES